MDHSEIERDLFISHANEDKVTVARPLATKLIAAGMKVWLDEYEIRLGDSLRKKLDEGLRISRFGVVILSKAFFSKECPKRELNALINKETDSRKVILPIWHEVDRNEVAQFSPLLVDKIAIRTSEGLDNVVNAIMRAYGATETHGIFRIFSSHFPTAPTQGLKHVSHMAIKYLDFSVSYDTANIEVHFRGIENFDPQIHTAELFALADRLWEPAIRLLCVLAGCAFEDVVAGRPKMHETGLSIKRSIDAPHVRFDEWKGYNAILHLRGYQILRDIDSDYLDLYFMPVKDPYSDVYEELVQEESVIERLNSFKPIIVSCLAQIGAAAVGEHMLPDAVVRKPVFDKDCVPVWGGGAYWFKAMLK